MSINLKTLNVNAYNTDRVPNPFPRGDLPWQTYHTVRNAIVTVCRQFGPTGPMGIVKIVMDVENPAMQWAYDRDFWEPGDPEPTKYFILDDQLNHERYCYAELEGVDALHEEWLRAIVTVLRQFEGWGLGVNSIPDSYLLIFGDKLLVNGRLAKCRTASEVVSTAQKLVRLGPKKWWQFWR